jgi:seryl-tRNA synthetase
MLDATMIRQEPDRVRAQLNRKGFKDAGRWLDAFLAQDGEHATVRRELESKQAELNANSKRIGELKRQGEDPQTLLDAMGALSSEVKVLKERERDLAASREQALLELPNLPDASVPDGLGEEDSVVVHERDGQAPTPAPKPHWEWMTERGWLDLDAGTKLAGAGFPVMRGNGVRLQRALETFFLDTLGKEGFTEMRVPLLANEASARATGQLPDKEGQMYGVDDGFYLIPTSEVALTNLHRDEILDADQLPIRYTALTPCFRREAGSYGKDVRGLNRVHQFDKVEMVAFVSEDEAHGMLEAMTQTAERMLEQLGLRYRRLLLCTGDMGFTQTKTYDLEVWSPGQERFLEVSSVSLLGDFQSRRLQTRARPGGVAGSGGTTFVHTLNGSALALPRTMAALIETYADADGDMRVPDVLQDRLGVKTLA